MALTAEDFSKVDQAEFDAIMATGYAPEGEPGTSQHALAVADALSYVDADIYYDYEEHAEQDGYPKAAATHANISSLQSAASYCAAVMKALAAHPELLQKVRAAVEAANEPVAGAAPR